MANIKHIGRLKTSKRRVIVPYRTIPGDPYSALVVFVDTLSADEHDSLIRVVESASGQQAYELAEVMHRSFLPDGRNMLTGFYKTGKLQKIATSDVEMIPNSTSSVGLDELNKLIAEGRGVSLEDLSLKPGESKTEQTPAVDPAVVETAVAEPITEAVADPIATAQPLSDEDIAKQLRSQADAMFKEAQRLRKEAEELAPTKKPTTTVKKPAAKKKESA
jgi:hypothetical protein